MSMPKMYSAGNQAVTVRHGKEHVFINHGTRLYFEGDKACMATVWSTKELADSRAAFIVQACNAYAVLRDALEEQITGAEWRRENEPAQWNGADDEALVRAKAALALAEGK